MSTRRPTPRGTSRREALRLGGAALGLGAIVAACGDDESGEEAGRVGYAPPTTELGDYPVTDATLLRTLSSYELSAVAVYDAALELDGIDGEVSEMLAEVRDSHQDLADEYGRLTESAGGEAWECTNPWLMERSIDPIFEAIAGTDNVTRDVYTLTISMENLTAATAQAMTTQLSEADLRVACAEAAAIESRQSAALAIAAGGDEAYASSEFFGVGVVLVDGVQPQFAITTQFGSVAQIPLLVGAADENGSREDFVLQTPAENSFVYEEYGTEC